ncbi:hypothetical protein [Idiomarina xiamenensis]|uniref:Phage protein n=1 Tax=Idiomarina xiamenensis 10-D-4 TaxID=740709 RepID=K2KQE8_9GAMM|nr:hypothetical protein [Idiomarina xiamenensis]EKE79715.1 phage protein [Idiomarina xiamenensis 10-D-4]
MSAPFVPQQRLTAIALGFKNAQFIADQVMPRTPVGSANFKWTEFRAKDTFTIPDSLVGRKSRPNEVEFGATEHTDSVVDFGLEDPIPNADIDEAKNNPAIDPEGRAAMKLAELIALGREKRVADKVMNVNNYNHSETLSGTDKWNAPESNLIEQISDAMDTPLVRPNTLVLGRTEATAMRRNLSLVKAFNGTNGDSGMVPWEFIRELFELENIIIGAARYNTANKGQDMSIERLWSGGASLLYINPIAALKDDVTFGMTAEHGERVAWTKPDENIGLRGGVRVRVGESVKEVVISKEAGFYFNAVL